MSTMTNRMEQFEQHRDRLYAIAYRMLGIQSEAQDIVQEAFVRWQDAQDKQIQSPGAYLTRVVTNLCIDELRSARKKRQEYVGPWLPEPLETDPLHDPSYSVELADSLSMAFLRLLEMLTPTERAVFLLREVFQLEYDEIAQAVGITSVNCRQIAHRARQRMRQEGRPRFEASDQQRDALMDRFEEAVRTGNLDMLKETLADDIILYSDGGGKVIAARRPLVGRNEVLRFLTGILRKYSKGITYRRTSINGEPGLITSTDDLPIAAWSFHIEEGRIQSIFAVRNPDKLGSIKN